MPTLKLLTELKADKHIVFDLSRSIDLHKISTKHTDETAIDGKTSGLIGINEYVTWRAKHFGIYQELTSKITDFERPDYFTDEMVKGPFKRFKHHHKFDFDNGITVMTDIFDYESPFGILGKIADRIFLKRYMIKLLEKRNQVIKNYAESDKYLELIEPTSTYGNNV